MKNVKNYLMLLMFMMVGVLGLGFTSSAETYVDWEGNPKTLEKLDNPYVNENGEEVVYKKLQIKEVRIVPTMKYGSGSQGKADDVLAYVDRGTITNEVYKTYWEMVDANTGEVYRCGGDWIESDNKAYWDGCKIEALPKRFTGTFYMRMRYEVGSEEDYINGSSKFSEWSDPYYFVTQPKLEKKKKSDVKNNYTKVKWKKMKGDNTYIVYMRKNSYMKNKKTKFWSDECSHKWYKVATTKKNSVKIKKFRGKKINNNYNNYSVKVIVRKKCGGKTIKSTVNAQSGATFQNY